MKPRIYVYYPGELCEFVLLFLGHIKTHKVLEFQTMDELLNVLRHDQHLAITDSLIVIRFDASTRTILQQAAILVRRYPAFVGAGEEELTYVEPEVALCRTWYPALLQLVNEDDLAGFGYAISRLVNAHTLPQA